MQSLIWPDVLPIVRVTLEAGLDDESAAELVHAEPPLDGEPLNATTLISEHRVGVAPDNRRQSRAAERRLFQSQQRKGLIALGRDELTRLEPSHLFVCRPVERLPAQFFLKVIAEIAIVQCDECCRVRRATRMANRRKV